MRKKRSKPDPEEEPDDLFSLAASRAAGKEGMERVLGNTREWWRANVYRLLREKPPEIPEPFLAEDFWAYALPLIGSPHSYRALGAMWNQAIVQDFVVATGERAQCRKITNHANQRDLYVWGPGPGVKVKL